MNQTTLQIKTRDGSCPSHLFQPQGTGPWPAAILFMDAFGPRPGLFEMAGRLSSNGYCVLLPDLFYRTGPYQPFDPAIAFNDPAERDKAAASFHGARLATDKPDSPHLLAPKMRGEIYVGVAGIDQHFTPEERDRLDAALTAAHVRRTVEVYDGAKHGFAVNDTPVYEPAASEKHWARLLDLFQRNLKNH